MMNETMKPLCRWTIGNVAPVGFKILKHAIRSFRSIYEDEFDLLVCHNSLNDDQLAILEEYGVELFEQTPEEFVVSLPEDFPSFQGRKVFHPWWKLYPPRLRLEAHELIIDNDLVILERVPHIDRFLNSNDLCLMTVGADRCMGCFEDDVPKGFKINSGFIGLPPGYDFCTDLVRRCKDKVPQGWSSHFDEQGAVSACLMNKQCELIPFEIPRRVEGSYGIHFVGSNGGNRTDYDNFFQIRIL